MKRWAILIKILFLCFLVLSCATTIDSIGDSWTPELFFKNAQEAMDERRYNDALFYYEVFLVRFPENYEKSIAAEYERTFIHYKTGKTKIAEDGFNAILDKYENDIYAVLYPPRFKLLCEIGLKNIKRDKAVNTRLFWRVQEKKWAETEETDEIIEE